MLYKPLHLLKSLPCSPRWRLRGKYGIISSLDLSLFSRGEKRQRSAASKIEQRLLLLLLLRACPVGAGIRDLVPSLVETTSSLYHLTSFLTGRFCVFRTCEHHWCISCEWPIIRMGPLLESSDLLHEALCTHAGSVNLLCCFLCVVLFSSLVRPTYASQEGERTGCHHCCVF